MRSQRTSDSPESGQAPPDLTTLVPPSTSLNLTSINWGVKRKRLNQIPGFNRMASPVVAAMRTAMSIVKIK